MPSLVRTLAPAVLLATSLSCGKSQPAPTTPADKTDAPGTPPIADSQQPTALAPVDNAQQLLPPDLQLLFEGKSLARAAEVFQRDKVAKELPDIYREVSRQLERVFGVDIFVPANLPGIGVDPDGEVGIALLDAKQDAFCVYAKLTDPSKFREVVMSSAGRHGVELSPTSMGGAEMLKARNGEVAVVLREPYAILVGSDRPKDGSVDYARIIATMDPSQSLANARAFKKATAGWVGPDGLVYANFAAFIDAIAPKSPKAEASTHNWAADELAQARKNGADAAEIQRLEARVKEVDESNKRWARRRKAERELVDFMFGKLDTLAMRIDAKRSGALIEGRVHQGADAFPRSLVRNSKGTMPLTSALSGKPVILAEGAFEVDAAFDLAARIAQADGNTWRDAVKEIKRETGVDVIAEVRPLLTGQGGGAVTLDADLRTLKTKDMKKNVGFAVHVEVGDGARAKAVIAKAMAKVDIDGQKFKKDAGGWSMSVKDYRKIYVKVEGDHVVVSTDPGLAGRLASGTPGTVQKDMKPAAGYAAMSMKDQAFTYVQDFGFLGSFFFMGRSSFSSMEHRGDKPKSRTVRKKLAELKKLDKKIEAQQEIVSNKEMQQMLDALEPFGSTVLVASEQADGFVVRGGQFIRAEGMGELIVHAAKMITNGFGRSPEQEKLSELFNQRFRLEEEIRELRSKDEARLKAPKKR